MKKLWSVLGLTLGFGMLTLVLGVWSGKSAAAQNAPASGPPGGLAVNVVNTPLPVTGSLGVSGTVQAQQSGPWNVGINNPASSPVFVRNLDEPARNPYQEAIHATCTGSQFCNFDFSTVPAGMRLTVTNISGFVDVTNGTLPNALLESSFGGSQFALVNFTGVKGPTASSGTRIFFNVETRAFFGAGETPHGFAGLVSTTDTFSGGGALTLTGYFVNP